MKAAGNEACLLAPNASTLPKDYPQQRTPAAHL